MSVLKQTEAFCSVLLPPNLLLPVHVFHGSWWHLKSGGGSQSTEEFGATENQQQGTGSPQQCLACHSKRFPTLAQDHLLKQTSSRSDEERHKHIYVTCLKLQALWDRNCVWHIESAWRWCVPWPLLFSLFIITPMSFLQCQSFGTWSGSFGP